MQLQLRTETCLSHSAGQQAMAADELIAVFELPESRILQLDTLTLAIPPDQSASWQVCA
jgi:hypothetical protein